jgi:CheY-like chemotaxis protein
LTSSAATASVRLAHLRFRSKSAVVVADLPLVHDARFLGADPESFDMPKTTSTRTTPSKILIADDNEQNRELLEAYLSDGDYEIEMAVDGPSTLEKVKSFGPDLVLLDIMMPKLSGYEVCQRLKADKKAHDIPILMVTALNEMGDIEKAVAAGCDDFLTKPVNRLELTTRVRSLLRVRHLTNERDRLLAYLAEVETVLGPRGTAKR